MSNDMTAETRTFHYLGQVLAIRGNQLCITTRQCILAVDDRLYLSRDRHAPWRAGSVRVEAIAIDVESIDQPERHDVVIADAEIETAIAEAAIGDYAFLLRGPGNDPLKRWL